MHILQCKCTWISSGSAPGLTIFTVKPRSWMNTTSESLFFSSPSSLGEDSLSFSPFTILLSPTPFNLSGSLLFVTVSSFLSFSVLLFLTGSFLSESLLSVALVFFSFLFSEACLPALFGHTLGATCSSSDLLDFVSSESLLTPLETTLPLSLLLLISQSKSFGSPLIIVIIDFCVPFTIGSLVSTSFWLTISIVVSSPFVVELLDLSCDDFSPLVLLPFCVSVSTKNIIVFVKLAMVLLTHVGINNFF